MAVTRGLRSSISGLTTTMRCLRRRAALVALAEAALGDGGLAASLPAQPGQTNAVIWTILALRQAGRPLPRELVRSARSPGSLGRLGVGEGRRAGLERHGCRRPGTPGRRRLRSADPAWAGLSERAAQRGRGFALVANRASDAQSTAWAIQAFLAAGAPPPKGAFAYLASLRPRRRQLPLLEALRSDAGVGHRAGAARRHEDAVSAAAPTSFGG